MEKFVIFWQVEHFCDSFGCGFAYRFDSLRKNCNCIRDRQIHHWTCRGSFLYHHTRGWRNGSYYDGCSTWTLERLGCIVHTLALQEYSLVCEHERQWGIEIEIEIDPWKYGKLYSQRSNVCSLLSRFSSCQKISFFEKLGCRRAVESVCVRQAMTYHNAIWNA